VAHFRPRFHLGAFPTHLKAAKALGFARDGIQLGEAITGDGAAIFRHALRFGARRHRIEADRLPLCEWPDTAWLKTKNTEFRAAVMASESASDGATTSLRTETRAFVKHKVVLVWNK
jgi:hypothetical protein